MKTMLAVCLVVSLLPCCRIFRASEWRRRDRCIESMQILRSEPEHTYQIVKIVRGNSETDLLWRACAEHADAIISVEAGSVDNQKGKLQGYAIKWRR